MPPYALLAKASIKSLADLKGKVISVGGPKDITRLYVDRMLAPQGLKTGDYDYVYAGATTARAQALLRARPCAGDKAFGERLLAVLEPFIHPRHIDEGMVAEIRALRALFRGPADQGGAGQGFDVKLGAGGIRDVERRRSGADSAGGARRVGASMKFQKWLTIVATVPRGSGPTA